MYYLIFFLYNGVFIPIFFVVIHLAAQFNKKIKRGLKGRYHLFPTLRSEIKKATQGAIRIWIHISSYGEFEQVKPVILLLKEKIANSFIILSFFSPSGFDHAKGYPLADVITYLPADTYWNARKFISIIKPDVAMVVRHDLWPNFQWRLYQLAIPSLLINASIPAHRIRFIKLMRHILRQLYKTFSQIYVTTPENAQFFQIIFPFPKQIKVLGDTRFDQVRLRAAECEKIAFLQQSGKFQRDNCCVAGSTWPGDERVLLPAVKKIMQQYPHFQLIIVPHEPTVANIAAISDFFSLAKIPSIKLSQWSEGDPEFRVLIVDRVGLLANLYALGALAYVGGGFGAGVHNVLEPAAHETPVLFGPRHSNSIEAQQLIRINVGRCVENEEDIYQALREMLENKAIIKQRGQKAKQFIMEHSGAAERTVAEILECLHRKGRKIHG